MNYIAQIVTRTRWFEHSFGVALHLFEKDRQVHAGTCLEPQSRVLVHRGTVLAVLYNPCHLFWTRTTLRQWTLRQSSTDGGRDRHIVAHINFRGRNHWLECILFRSFLVLP